MSSEVIVGETERIERVKSEMNTFQQICICKNTELMTIEKINVRHLL